MQRDSPRQENTLETARRLRRDMTEAEKVMWRILRARQLAGYKFRRQQPIDHYIVDFVCFSH
jgi:very-short-patch-repair endonuclease